MTKAKRKMSATETADARLLDLLEHRRWCYVIPMDALVDGHGFRVSIAIENEPGTGLPAISRPSRRSRRYTMRRSRPAQPCRGFGA